MANEYLKVTELSQNKSINTIWGLQLALLVKNLPASAGDIYPGFIPGQEDPLEKRMASHSSILAWKIPGTEEPVGLQPMGLQRIGHD